MESLTGEEQECSYVNGQFDLLAFQKCDCFFMLSLRAGEAKKKLLSAASKYIQNSKHIRHSLSVSVHLCVLCVLTGRPKPGPRHQQHSTESPGPWPPCRWSMF